MSMEHEHSFDELQRDAFEKVHETDKKLAKIKKMLVEREAYLVEASSRLP